MAVYRVSTAGQFDAALKSARGGDSILLSSGTYDKLTVSTAKSGYGHTNFASKVTIASADPGRPAVVNDLMINGAGNIEFKNIKFDWVPSKTEVGPIFIQNARKITLNDIEVEGHLSGKYGNGVGVRVRNSQEFTLINSDIEYLKNGLNVTNVSNLVINNNNFKYISVDGMQVGGLTGAVISGNDFRQFNSDPNVKHKDAIQIINGSGMASRNVLINDNVIVNPEQSHGIFMGNALAQSGNLSAYYRNITVEDNYLHTAHKHGITVEHGYGITIRNNTINQNFEIFKAGNQINMPVINASSSSLYVTITGNKVASVPDAANKTWVVSGNSTGTKNILHWDSSIKASSSLAAEAPPPELVKITAVSVDSGATGAPATSVGGNGGPAETFRFNGKIAATDATFYVRDVEFENRDVIIFRSFEAGTFANEKGGNKVDVFDNGASVKIDNALDLQEVAAMSKAVSMSAGSDDTLLVKIAQKGGTADLAFDNLGDDFRAANHPELF